MWDGGRGARANMPRSELGGLLRFAGEPVDRSRRPAPKNTMKKAAAPVVRRRVSVPVKRSPALKASSPEAKLLAAIYGKPVVPPSQKAEARLHARLKAEQKRFVDAVASVKVTPDVERRVDELVSKARRARQADFLAKYRTTAG